MEFYLTLRGKKRAAILAWLHTLADYLNSQHSPNPMRWDASTNVNLQVNREFLPLVVRQHGPYMLALYAMNPRPNEPMSMLGVWERDDDTTIVLPWSSESFPIDATEVLRQIELHVDTDDAKDGEEEESRQQISTAGAPTKACNIWLESQMRALANPADYQHLYDEWLRRYEAEHSFFPRDPRRCFAKAANRALDRINADQKPS